MPDDFDNKEDEEEEVDLTKPLEDDDEPIALSDVKASDLGDDVDEEDLLPDSDDEDDDVPEGILESFDE